MAGLQALGKALFGSIPNISRKTIERGDELPTYDFKCEQCSNTFELNLSFDNKDLQYCEDCEKPLVRIYAPVAAIFKGTGWGKSN